MCLFTININHKFPTRLLNEISERLSGIEKNIKSIMTTIADLNAKVDELQVALDVEQAQILNAIGALEDTVAELRDLVAAGGTPEELQALADKIDAIKTDLQATIPDTVEETTTVAPETTEAPTEG